MSLLSTINHQPSTIHSGGIISISVGTGGFGWFYRFRIRIFGENGKKLCLQVEDFDYDEALKTLKTIQGA